MDSLTFEEQRLHLRQQLWARRQKMVEKMHSRPRAKAAFPRSAAMNFFMRAGGTQAALTLATALFARKKVLLVSAVVVAAVAAYFYASSDDD